MSHLPLRLVLALSDALALPLASCGGDKPKPDAELPQDSDIPRIPDPPQLGTQIERMGRPLIATALIGLRDAADVAAAKRDAYNAASDPARWAAATVDGSRSILREMASNLPILDLIDKGSAAISGPPPPGCQNQLFYNGNPLGGGGASAASYDLLAELLADDMVYLDTGLLTCSKYLSLEIEFTTSTQIMHKECGGRAPAADVMDATYSALISGVNGFTAQPALFPRISDGVAARPDLVDAPFPYFPAPH